MSENTVSQKSCAVVPIDKTSLKQRRGHTTVALVIEWLMMDSQDVFFLVASHLL